MKRILLNMMLLLALAVSWSIYPPMTAEAQKNKKTKKTDTVKIPHGIAFLIDSFDRRQAHLDSLGKFVVISAKEFYLHK